MPQLPQLLGSETVNTQLPSHIVAPAAQRTSHSPERHTAMPFVGVEQTLPHKPQFWALVEVSAQ